MKKFLRLLCSLPVVLLTLYFIPFLGICLILFRFYLYRSKDIYKFFIAMLVFGVVLLIPQLISSIWNTFKISFEIPYLNAIVLSDLYLHIVKYSKFLIIVSVIFMILSYVFSNVSAKLSSSISNYIKKEEENSYQIRKENDLEIQKMKEEVKNTHLVKCPSCGQDNMLTSKIGVCKSCRRKLEYKE